MRLEAFIATLVGIGSACLGASRILAGDQPTAGPPPAASERTGDCTRSPVRAIHFDDDQLGIRPDRMPDLDRVAAWMSACPAIRVRLEGHTDDRYTAKYALTVSQRLAGSARDYLVKKGVRESRIETVGWGRYRPASPGISEEGRSLNRRVEILACDPACSGKSVRLVGTYVVRAADEASDELKERIEIGDPTRGWRSEDPLVWTALYLEIKPALFATGKRWAVRVTRWHGDPDGLRHPLRPQPPTDDRLLDLRPVGRKHWPRIPAETNAAPLRHPLYRLEYDGKPDYEGVPLIYFLLGEYDGDGQLRFVLERDGVPACEIRVKTYSPGC